MLYGILIFIHILVSFLLVVVILLQSGKGGGLAGSLGGTVSTAMFGGQGADKLMLRLTTGLATAFMVLAILISIAGSGADGVSSDSIVRQRAADREATTLQPLSDFELPEATEPAALPLPIDSDSTRIQN